MLLKVLFFDKIREDMIVRTIVVMRYTCVNFISYSILDHDSNFLASVIRDVMHVYIVK